jgi:hypothetical protein
VIYDHFAGGNCDENLFVRLAGCGFKGAVAYLLEKGFADSELAGEAFVSAMGGSQPAIANVLLDTELVPSTAVDTAFKQVARHGSMKSVEFLLSKGLVSPQAICTAFDKTTSFAVVQVLLEKEHISPESVIAAFRSASRRCGNSGRTDAAAIVRALSKHASISADVMSEAFLGAVDKSCGSAAMVKLLFDEDRISAGAVRTAFKTAAARIRRNCALSSRQARNSSSLDAKRAGECSSEQARRCRVALGSA